MTPAPIRCGALVRWCIHLNRRCEAVVLRGEVKAVPYTEADKPAAFGGCALVTVRDTDGRAWIERDIVLLVGDLVAVQLRPAAEVVPIGAPVGGEVRLLPGEVRS